MYPRPFSYVRATSVDHAVSVLAEHVGAAEVLAGGCSIIPLMKYRTRSPEVLVDIRDLEDDLKYVREEDGMLRIGAMVRHTDAMLDPAAQAQPIVPQVAAIIADTQVRNMGTVVGGICAVEPTGDWLPPLLALRGTVIAVSPGGEREVPADELAVAPFQNGLRSDELATEVRFPVRTPGTGASHQKVTVRVNAGAINCSAAVRVDDGVIAEVGIAFGALERHPFRASAAEEVVRGQRLDEDLLERAAVAALTDVQGYTDGRGTADFRRAAGAALLKRAVREAHARATTEVYA
jgi:aerobic carbon-monoxide dehydrogenase medium subunit